MKYITQFVIALVIASSIVGAAPVAQDTEKVGSVHTTDSDFSNNATISGMQISGSGESANVVDASESWSASMASLPSPTNQPQAVGYNGMVYIVGGEDSSGNSKTTLWRYNPDTDSYTSLPNMPVARSDHGAAIVGDKIYVIGGTSTGSNTLSSMSIYDISEGTWSSGANMPHAKRFIDTAVMNGKIYVGTGFNAENKFHVYDTETNSWTTLTDTPFSRRKSYVMTLGGNIYIGGGSDAFGNVYVDWYRYDGGSYTQVSDIALGRMYASSTEVDGTGYLLGGRTGSGSTSATVQTYIPDTWTNLGTNMVQFRNQHASAYVGGYMYVLGGYDGSSVLAHTERKAIVAGTGEYSAEHSFSEEPSRAFVNMTLTNATASVTIEGYDGSTWVSIANDTFTTSANHTIPVSKTGYEKYRTSISFDNTDSSFTTTLHDEGYLYELGTQKLTIETRTYLKHNQSSDFHVKYITYDSELNRNVSIDVTENASITVNKPSLININKSNNTITATNNKSINEIVEITAVYETSRDTHNVTVANRTINNIGILPPTEWVPATTGSNIGGPDPTHAQFQWLFLAILFGLTAGKLGNAWSGLAVIEALLIIGWIMEWVTLGFLIVSVFIALFQGIQLSNVVEVRANG